MYPCPFCNRSFKNAKMLKLHVKVDHGSVRKTCYCKFNDCSRSYNSLYSYTSHLDKAHLPKTSLSFSSFAPNINPKKIDDTFMFNDNETFEKTSFPIIRNKITETNSYIVTTTSDLVYPNNSVALNNNIVSSDRQLIEFYNNQFLKTTQLVVKLYSIESLSRTIIHDIMNLFSDFYKSSLEFLKINSVNTTDVSAINNKVDIIQNSFSPFSSEHATFKYLKNLGLFIEPSTVTINSFLCPRRIRNKKRLVVKDVSIEVVPLKPVLKKFLQLPNVLKLIETFINNNNESDSISSMIQTANWKKIACSYSGKIVLPLIFFIDDYEVNNPLGSHRGLNKLGGVYYTIGCIPFQFSYKLKNIFLAQIYKTKDYERFGNAKIFFHLVEQLRELENTGIPIDIDGEKKTVYFVLSRIAGDNLGLNSVLGFSKSFNSSFYCRICLINKKKCQELLKERRDSIRTKSNYKKDLKNNAHGINEECIFNKLSNFHVIDNLSIDPMHDLYEGICRYELGEVLHYIIKKKKYISLDILNERLKLLNVSSSSGPNVPSEIPLTTLKKKLLVLSASKMKFFMLHLGIIIGDLIPKSDEVWQLYVMLREIICIVTATYFNNDSCVLLNNLIYKHHKSYIKLIGSLKPKHHFLVHYVRVMKKIGPLKYVSSMKFENKHSQFKNTARVVRSRVNIAHTLAVKHQLELAYRFFINDSMEDELIIGSDKPLTSTAILNLPNLGYLSSRLRELNFISHFTLNGILYKTDMVIYANKSGKLPEFGKILYIVCVDTDIILIINLFETLIFDNHIGAFEIQETSKTQAINKNELIDHNTFDLHELPNHKKVIVKLCML